MIQIKKSPTADTRTCDFANTSKETLLQSSMRHIDDVRLGLEYFRTLILAAAAHHDHDKLSDIEGFHRDFVTGFTQTTWWADHRLSAYRPRFRTGEGTKPSHPEVYSRE